MLEIFIQKTILEYLQIRGHSVWRNNTGMWRSGGLKERFIRFGKKGSSDILGWEKGTGRFIAFEIKRGKEKPTEEQAKFLEKLNKDGGFGMVAYSVDDVIEAGF